MLSHASTQGSTSSWPPHKAGACEGKTDISVALGMTYAGARADTAVEMKKALRFALPEDRVHTGFNYLDLACRRRCIS